MHIYVCIVIVCMQTQGEQAYQELRLIRHCGFPMSSKRSSCISIALSVYEKRISNLASKRKEKKFISHLIPKTIKND